MKPKFQMTMYSDININRVVIPGLTRNPVFFGIPAFAGMTCFVVINVAVYKNRVLKFSHLEFIWHLDFGI
jgi:hypothetical protein